MNCTDKKLIMNAVLEGTLKNVQDAFEGKNLEQDDSFFDYELLKAALRRKHQGIANYLILKKGCRVRNQSKNNLRETTPLHLAMKLNKTGFVQKILIRGASIYDKDLNGDVPVYAAFKKGYFCPIEDVLNHCCRLKNMDPNNKVDVLHFHMACVTGDLKSVKMYLEFGFDTNSPLSLNSGEYVDINSHIFSNSVHIYPGMTPLHFAAMYGFEEIVQVLLKNGADSNKLDGNGRTPLHSAIIGTSELEFDIEEKGLRSDIIKMLLDENASIDVTDKYKCTPLHLAFYNKDIQENQNILDLLLSNVHWGPKPKNFTDHQGLSYFHIICTTNDVNQVKEFLNNGVNVNSKVTSGMYDGYTALHFAVLYNQRKVVELLLKSNAKVNVNTTEKKSSPLHLACEYNYVKFQRLSSDFDWATQNNKAADIDWTLNCENQLIIIKLLLLHGADIEMKDLLGRTALLCAGEFDFCYHCELCWSDSFKSILRNELGKRLEKIIGTLLYNKANVNSRTKRQFSLFHVFSKNFRFLDVSDELICHLVNKGLEIDAVDETGLTPLHVAVKYDNKQMVQLLLKNQANVNAESNNFRIPLQIAMENYVKHSPEKRDIICMLLENGSKVNLINENGRSLLSEAIAERNIFIVAKLLDYGADINIKDLSGKSPVFDLYKWKKTLSDWKDIKYAKLFQIVYIHVQRLLALGRHVCTKVKKCCNDLYPLYQKALLKSDQLTDIDHIYDDCTKELDDMKLAKIDNYTSLYSILLKDCTALTKHINNSSFIQIVTDEKTEELFPYYSYLLKVQFRKGLVRSSALQNAKSSLDHVIGFNLPNLCYDLIIKHLSNEDVANLHASLKKSNNNKNL